MWWAAGCWEPRGRPAYWWSEAGGNALAGPAESAQGGALLGGPRRRMHRDQTQLAAALADRRQLRVRLLAEQLGELVGQALPHLLLADVGGRIAGAIPVQVSA